MCICHQRGSVELQLKHEGTEAERGLASVSLLGGAGAAQAPVCSQHLRSGWRGKGLRHGEEFWIQGA